MTVIGLSVDQQVTEIGSGGNAEPHTGEAQVRQRRGGFGEQVIDLLASVGEQGSDALEVVDVPPDRRAVLPHEVADLGQGLPECLDRVSQVFPLVSEHLGHVGRAVEEVPHRHRRCGGAKR